MKLKLLQSLLLVLSCICLRAQDQSLKGVWQGFITADGLLTRAIVIHVKDLADGIITGRSYIYDIKYPSLAKNTEFRGELDFIGIAVNNTINISELTILDSVKLSDEAFLCTKILTLKIYREGEIDLMKGTWNGAIYSKQKCPSGVLFLKRYDFSNPPVEPIPPIINGKISADNSPKITFLKTELTKPIILNVARTTITIDVRDYLNIDNDTVSIFYNRNPIVKDLLLRRRPKSYTIKIDKLSALNEIIMYAKNLGRIPPNTSSITVYDGIKRQNVVISSTLESSAVIYLKYAPLDPRQ